MNEGEREGNVAGGPFVLKGSEQLSSTVIDERFLPNIFCLYFQTLSKRERKRKKGKA